MTRVAGLGSIDYLYVMGLEAEVAITKPAADKLGAEYWTVWDDFTNLAKTSAANDDMVDFCTVQPTFTIHDLEAAEEPPRGSRAAAPAPAAAAAPLPWPSRRHPRGGGSSSESQQTGDIDERELNHPSWKRGDKMNPRETMQSKQSAA